MRIYKKWIKITSLIILSFLLIIASFNYLLDPLWSFNNFYFTKYKNSYNERVLKTNYLVYSKVKFDGILLGSSRSSLIDTHRKFEEYQIFNYSCASLQISEYEGFINNAKQINHNKLPIVILGLDFFTYLNGSKLENNPEKYYEDNKDFFYRFKNLISYDSFKKAKKNLRISDELISERVYDSNYNVFISKNSEENNKKNIEESVPKFVKEFYLKESSIENFSLKLKELKEKFPDTRFVIFTTPITKELFSKIIENKKLYELYENWIKDVVGVFGEVNHFMFINDISTQSSKNFYDGHHTYPFVGDIIYESLISNVSTNNMMKINNENLDEMVEKLRKVNFINN
ncbi:MAG: hypothetical protein PHY66_11785 [Aliarcobacter sp.]|nr:hypothetical protein [Aliarcobacter sp.]